MSDPQKFSSASNPLKATASQPVQSFQPADSTTVRQEILRERHQAHKESGNSTTPSMATLPSILAPKYHQFIVERNAFTSSDLDISIHQHFEAQALHTPDAIAVIFEEEMMTYRQLNQKANQLAHYLQRSTIGPDVLVGIYLERSIEMVVAILGILKAGGAYVPLDVELPEERLAFMLQDTHMPILLTQQLLGQKLSAYQTQLLYLDTDWPTIAQEQKTNPLSNVQPTNLSYVIYTSGSTGKPKGVMITHRALVNHMLWMQKAFPLMVTDRVLQKTPFSFDASVWEFFAPLLSGACLVMAQPGGHRDTHYLVQTLVQQQISILQLVPSLLRVLLTEKELENCLHLRHVFCGGEALSVDLQRRFSQHLPIPLHNLYGPTEACIDATCWTCQHGNEQSNVPIGRPIANTQRYILDAHLQPTPITLPGELYIGGMGLARGYFNRPELTAERFIPHPFSDNPSERLYKTGDLVRSRTDGVIEFLGRLDEQIKIRGHRIELGEIETVLLQHPAIREAVVRACEDTPGDQRLVAYIVPHKQQTISIAELQQLVIKQLPSYMLPSAFLFLEALPISPNGKIDRRNLPAPTKTLSEEPSTAPTLLAHHQLVKIWEELLGVQGIGIADNFFYLGGHSFLAAHLIDRIEQSFGKRLQLSTLFASPTIEQLARILQKEDEMTGERCKLIRVQNEGPRRPFFFLHGDWTGGAFYCFTLARILGPEQPFYVLEPYKFDGLQVPPTLEEIAAAHLKLLRSIQPDGPYLLGGFCNGALIAFEMARQLQMASQQIDLLALITPTAPAQYRAFHRTVCHLGSLVGLNRMRQANVSLRLRHALRHIYRHICPGDQRLQDFNQLIKIEPGLNRIFPSQEMLYRDYVGVLTWIEANYMPAYYSGKVTYFWTHDEPALADAWHKEAKSQATETYSLPGTQMSCVTTYTAVIGEYLKQCLSKA